MQTTVILSLFSQFLKNSSRDCCWISSVSAVVTQPLQAKQSFNETFAVCLSLSLILIKSGREEKKLTSWSIEPSSIVNFSLELFCPVFWSFFGKIVFIPKIKWYYSFGLVWYNHLYLQFLLLLKTLKILFLKYNF